MRLRINNTNKFSRRLVARSYKASSRGFVGDIEDGIGNRPESFNFHDKIDHRRDSLVKRRRVKINFKELMMEESNEI